jgi:hypothetical protein
MRAKQIAKPIAEIFMMLPLCFRQTKKEMGRPLYISIKRFFSAIEAAKLLA